MDYSHKMSLKRHWAGYAWAVGATAVCTFVGLAMFPRFDLVNVAMVYLLAVVVIALRFSRGPAIAASVLCVAAFDFVFVPPRHVHCRRCPVSVDLRHHAGRRAHHFPARQERPAPGSSAGGARNRSRDRADSQHVARLDIARSTHAARR